MTSREIFDVIVVGGGTAGCVLAERLSRSGKLQVLLVDAYLEPALQRPNLRVGVRQMCGEMSQPPRAPARGYAEVAKTQ